MHSELSYGLSFAPKLQRVAVIDLSGSHQPTPDPSFSHVFLGLKKNTKKHCAHLGRHSVTRTNRQGDIVTLVTLTKGDKG